MCQNQIISVKNTKKKVNNLDKLNKNQYQDGLKIELNSNKLNSSINKQIILNKEYSNLKNLIPNLTNKPKISKVNLINEAVKYINELQDQVLQKLNSLDANSQIKQQKILLQLNNFNQNSNSKTQRRLPLEQIGYQKSIKRKRI